MNSIAIKGDAFIRITLAFLRLNSSKSLNHQCFKMNFHKALKNILLNSGII